MTAGGTDHSELELAPTDLLDHVVRVRDGERDVHERVQLLELTEDDGQDAAARPGGSADLEPALELALRLFAEVCEQLLLEREQPLRSAVQPEPRLGRLDSATRAVEKP